MQSFCIPARRPSKRLHTFCVSAGRRPCPRCFPDSLDFSVTVDLSPALQRASLCCGGELGRKRGCSVKIQATTPNLVSLGLWAKTAPDSLEACPGDFLLCTGGSDSGIPLFRAVHPFDHGSDLCLPVGRGPGAFWASSCLFRDYLCHKTSPSRFHRDRGTPKVALSEISVPGQSLGSRDQLCYPHLIRSYLQALNLII